MNYKRILIANRGEIAVRIIRACKELGIETVAVHSTKDEGALHTRLSDYRICIGSTGANESYLNSYNILSAAEHMKVDAIHPGIGFFAENGDFAELCENSGIDCIGPGSTIIRSMGSKIEAKRIAQQCGVKVIEGDFAEVSSVNDCYHYIEEHGFPVILKSVNGGGGKGIRVVHSMEELPRSLELCRKETANSFGLSTVLIEKYIMDAKHIEVQILGDQYGNVIHLGNRECTIQRAHQKLIEEAQSMSVSLEIQQRMCEDSVRICKYIGYIGPGTIEYLLQPDGTYYFMEMNTRLQVEHTITEMITGVDIVKEQIMAAEGKALNYRQDEICFHGYALQCRIIAEYFKKDFVPSFGKIRKWHLPGGFGVRVETGYEYGDEVAPYYDSLLAKVCCYGSTKEEAVCKILHCLKEIEVEGIHTNVPFLIKIIKDDCFLQGNYTTNYVQNMIEQNQNETAV